MKEIELNDFTPLSQCSGTDSFESFKISRVREDFRNIVEELKRRKVVGTIIPEKHRGILLDLGIKGIKEIDDSRDLSLFDFFQAILPRLREKAPNIFEQMGQFFVDIEEVMALIKVLALLKDKVALQTFLEINVSFRNKLVTYYISMWYGHKYLPYFSLLSFCMENSSKGCFTTLYESVSRLGSMRGSPSEFWDENKCNYIQFLSSAMKRKDLDLVDFLTECEIKVQNKKYNIWFNSKCNESQRDDQISSEVIQKLQFLFVEEEYDFMEKLCDLLFKKHQKVYTALSNTCCNTEHNEYKGYKELFLWFSDKLKLNQAPQEPLSSYKVLTR